VLVGQGEGNGERSLDWKDGWSTCAACAPVQHCRRLQTCCAPCTHPLLPLQALNGMDMEGKVYDFEGEAPLQVGKQPLLRRQSRDRQQIFWEVLAA